MSDSRRVTRSPTTSAAPARDRISARWASTPIASRARSSASPRCGRRRCRATSTTATWPTPSAAGVERAGGVPLAFNTIAVSDNQSQGTPGMRASLVSREVIADSIELMDVAHDFDALVCIVGCDKTVPAALMALARIDKPAVVLFSGPMRAGRWRGERATILDVWEAVGGGAARGAVAARPRRPRASSRAPVSGPARGTSPRPRWGWRSSSSGSPRSARRWCRRTTLERAPRRRRALRRAGDARRSAAAAGAALARLAAERDDRDRGERRLDQRRPAPARDRARGRRRARLRRPVRGSASRRR